MPHLTDHDLRQMDEAWLQSLPEPMVRSVLGRVVADLKEARDRLNQHPANSSRPPGSRLPWENRQMAEPDETVEEAGEVVRITDPTPAVAAPEEPAVPRGASQKAANRQPGRQPGPLVMGAPKSASSRRKFTGIPKVVRPVAAGYRRSVRPLRRGRRLT